MKVCADLQMYKKKRKWKKKIHKDLLSRTLCEVLEDKKVWSRSCPMICRENVSMYVLNDLINPKDRTSEKRTVIGRKKEKGGENRSPSALGPQLHQPAPALTPGWKEGAAAPAISGEHATWGTQLPWGLEFGAFLFLCCVIFFFKDLIPLKKKKSLMFLF